MLEVIDQQVEKCRKAEMRVLLIAPWYVPDGANEDYYLKYGKRYTWKGPLLYLEPGGNGLQREFLEKMVARYASSDVQIVFGEEYLLPLRAAFYDTSAVAQFGEDPIQM